MLRDSFTDPFAMPFANGVFADTGELLPPLDTARLKEISDGEVHPGPALADEQEQAEVKLSAQQASFGVVQEVAPGDLSQTGWAILFAATHDPSVEAALAPLLNHRRAEAGGAFRVFKGADGYRAGETASQWLTRHGTRLDVVEPLNGVPYYLLLVGSPDEIPLEFQYALDVHWAVGRLHFATPDDYRQYAESVVAYESGPAVQRDRAAAVFATAHDGDRATQLFTQQVAQPLTSSMAPRGPIGNREKFRVTTHVGDAATKQTLVDLLGGRGDMRPSLLLTGSHGVAYRIDDPQLERSQGAILCQDWEVGRPVTANDQLAAIDISSDFNVHGLIHIFFACFSAGWPEHDTFNHARRIAPRAMFAELPKALLAHPGGGALAVLGHVDRAWAYSFQSSRNAPQVQAFRDVISGLLAGTRIGHATDQFNVRWASLSAELTDLARETRFGRDVSDAQLASRWVARNDARNYIIFGDPAVRIRVEAL